MMMCCYFILKLTTHLLYHGFSDKPDDMHLYPPRTLPDLILTKSQAILVTKMGLFSFLLLYHFTTSCIFDRFNAKRLMNNNNYF